MGYNPTNCEHLVKRGNIPNACSCPSHQREGWKALLLGAQPPCVLNWRGLGGHEVCPDEKPRPRPAPPGTGSGVSRAR